MSEMKRNMIKKCLAGILIAMLAACDGGGGGSGAPDVEPGPTPPNNPVAPAPPTIPEDEPPDYSIAESLIATITGVTISSPPVVDFQVTDGFGNAIRDLTTDNVRFHIAKLLPAVNGSSSAWQSYINRVKTPEVNPENDPAIQATSERGGELTNNGDGTYVYTFITDVANVTDPVPVAYDPDLTHRVGIQFSGGPPANPTYDWVPATGATSNIESREIVDIRSCNNCHDQLALHGGGRIEAKLCVECHNPYTTEPNSLNTVDFKVMVHKIHRGANLPSVQAGGEYVIYGFRDSEHDYSHIEFPQDIRNCTNCHAGTATGSEGQILTSEGDNWNEVPTQAACGSCHDDVDFDEHMGGLEDDSACLLCHSESGYLGSVAKSHLNLTQEAMASFMVNILSVTNTAPGEFPVVNYSVTNPMDGDSFYDVLGGAEFDSPARFVMGVAWNTAEYDNIGNGGNNASYPDTDAIANSTANGDGTFQLVSEEAVPDGSVAPFIAATGSGAIVFEGHLNKNVATDGSEDIRSVPLTFAIEPFSIDEAGGTAQVRREVVSIDSCNACHFIKVNHGGNRANDTQGCVGCHNPKNTDRRVREIRENNGSTLPNDGKREESIDFKTLIHALHASGFREEPLEVVGFGGFSIHVFDEEHVQFPGHLNNCENCHINDSYALPLDENVDASVIDTGADIADPADDIMITPISAVCSSCHDDATAAAHMEQNGGDFSATAASIGSGASTETCVICHSPGAVADLEVVHMLD
jgi:OmcA/MtrC family decaheme c-type cytochrome